MADTANNPGYKTSEFWITVVTGIFVWLNESGVMGSFKIPTDVLSQIVAVAVSFVIGRLGLKAVSSAATTTANAKVEVAKAQAAAPAPAPLQVELTDKK